MSRTVTQHYSSTTIRMAAKPEIWPNPADSCDQHRQPLQWPNRDIKGLRDRCLGVKLWYITGPARDAYRSIESTIYSCLKNHEELHEGTHTYDPVNGVRCYMAGRKCKTARPCVGIWCSSASAFRSAVAAITEHPDWITFNSTHHQAFIVVPFLGKPPMQLGEDFPMRLDRQRQVDRCVYTPRTEPIRWGTPIYFKFPEGYRKAVLGGFVVLGREVYGLTTAHSAASFNNVSTPNSEPDTLDLDDEFLESLCPRDEDFPDSPDSQGTDCASETSSSDISLDIISSEEAYTVGATQAGFENAGSALDSILQEHQLDLLGHVAYMSVGDVNDAADWALIKISSPQTSFDPSSGLSDMTFYRDVLRTRLEADDVSKVTMIVSKVEYQGYIDVSPIRIRLPGATELISVAEVHMPNFEFQPGHCGTWVYSKSSISDGYTSFRGHIVAGDPGSSRAYVIPAIRLQESIQQQLNMSLLLPAQYKYPNSVLAQTPESFLPPHLRWEKRRYDADEVNFSIWSFLKYSIERSDASGKVAASNDGRTALTARTSRGADTDSLSDLSSTRKTPPESNRRTSTVMVSDRSPASSRQAAPIATPDTTPSQSQRREGHLARDAKEKIKVALQRLGDLCITYKCLVNRYEVCLGMRTPRRLTTFEDIEGGLWMAVSAALNEFGHLCNTVLHHLPRISNPTEKENILQRFSRRVHRYLEIATARDEDSTESKQIAQQLVVVLSQLAYHYERSLDDAFEAEELRLDALKLQERYRFPAQAGTQLPGLGADPNEAAIFRSMSRRASAAFEALKPSFHDHRFAYFFANINPAFPAVHTAVYYGRPQAAQFLLSPETYTETDILRRQVSHLAAETDNMTIFGLQSEQEEARDIYGMTPLAVAAANTTNATNAIFPKPSAYFDYHSESHHWESRDIEGRSITQPPPIIYWRCNSESCSTLNFPRRANCVRCGTSRFGSTVGAKKSHSPFAARLSHAEGKLRGQKDKGSEPVSSGRLMDRATDRAKWIESYGHWTGDEWQQWPPRP